MDEGLAQLAYGVGVESLAQGAAGLLLGRVRGRTLAQQPFAVIGSRPFERHRERPTVHRGEQRVIGTAQPREAPRALIHAIGRIVAAVAGETPGPGFLGGTRRLLGPGRRLSKLALARFHGLLHGLLDRTRP